MTLPLTFSVNNFAIPLRKLSDNLQNFSHVMVSIAVAKYVDGPCVVGRSTVELITVTLDDDGDVMEDGVCDGVDIGVFAVAASVVVVFVVFVFSLTVMN